MVDDPRARSYPLPCRLYACGVLAVLSVMGSAVSAHAGERPWAVTVSVPDLVRPMLNLQAERTVTQHSSLAVKTGFAKYESTHFSELTLLTVSAQGSYLVAGTLERGWRLLGDGEYGWSWMRGEDSFGHGTRKRAALLTGGRWTSTSGVVVQAQLGYGIGLTEIQSLAAGERLDTVWTYGPRGDLRLGLAF